MHLPFVIDNEQVKVPGSIGVGIGAPGSSCRPRRGQTGAVLKISNSEIRFFRFPVYLSADRVEIAVVEKDIPPIVPANRNVIDSAFIFNSKRSGHSHRLRNYNLAVDPKVQN